MRFEFRKARPVLIYLWFCTSTQYFFNENTCSPIKTISNFILMELLVKDDQH